jgi:hypothetical protein
MDIAHIAKILEIFAALLGVSSLVGPDRLEHWERSIRGYLNAKQSISRLSQKLRMVISPSYNFLQKPSILAFSITSFVATFGVLFLMDWYIFSGEAIRRITDLKAHPPNGYMDYLLTFGRGGTLIWMSSRIFGIGFTLWAQFICSSVFLTLITAFIVFVFINEGLKKTLRYALFEAEEENGKRMARHISYVIYFVVLAPTIVAYCFTFALSTPYLLAEKVANRFQLRPIFGVLTAILTVIALVLEFIIM